MKKFVIASISALALVGFSFGQTNEVSSVNAVGYMKLQLEPGGRLLMGGVNLLAVNGIDSIGVREYFGTNQLKRSNLSAACDKLYLWDTATQKYLTYGQKNDTYFYLADNGWATNPQTNPIVNNGTAFWILSQGAETSKTVYVMGGVPTQAAETNAIAGSASRPLYFLANPYPVSQTISNLINVSDGALANNIFAACDQIYIWEQSTQKYISYGLRVSGGWTRWTGSGWETPSSNVWVAPGKGFWFSTRTNLINWIETKPYTWPN